MVFTYWPKGTSYIQFTDVKKNRSTRETENVIRNVIKRIFPHVLKLKENKLHLSVTTARNFLKGIKGI